ncbi:22034_t:CDS:2 [Entrophospora sp. SA101]|nr:22034_t:CDS:2 [Entrophospora sp. SA101]
MVKDIETGNIQDGNQQGQQDGNQQGQQDENVNSGKIDDIFAQLENTKISIKENLEREEPPSCCVATLKGDRKTQMDRFDVGNHFLNRDYSLLIIYDGHGDEIFSRV